MAMVRFSMREETAALGQALVAFAVVMLIMVGIAGTVYRMIAPDGWIVEAFNRGLMSGMVLIGTMALVGSLLWFKRGAAALAKRTNAAEIIVMGFAGIGALFLLQGVLNSLL